MASKALPDRVKEKILVDPETGCWNWTAGVDGKGYGLYYVKLANGRWTTRRAHRVVYELVNGPITSETLDHLCRNPACVNPDHLEEVSNRENVLRGEGFAACNARKTHCPRGHPYDEVNTYRKPSGGRHCRKCRRIREGPKRCPNALKERCPRGHLYDAENTYRDPSGGRHCRTCRRAAQELRLQYNGVAKPVGEPPRKES